MAASPGFNFIGNVSLGEDIPLPLLANHYDALIFAYGAAKDRNLGLAGEDNANIYSARAFVGWYNGLPEYRDLDPNVQAGEDAIVIGQGNVALDVARTLLTDVDILRKTDITDYALEALAKSRIKNVKVVGRRGPLQAAFTIKEVRELLQLKGTAFKPIATELFPPDLKSLPRAKRRLMELLQKGSSTASGASKSWSLEFLLSPSSLNFSTSNALESVTFTRNTLTDPSSPSSAITPTDNQLTIPTTTLFRSIGYKATPISGFAQIGIAFDSRAGTIRHDGRGRASDLSSSASTSPPTAKLYCSGWVKRGPTGVIASTMADAFETAEAIVEDWKSDFRPGRSGSHSESTFPPDEGVKARLPARGWSGVKEELDKTGIKIDPVHWDGWDRIDRAEKAEGEAKGKPREKMGRVEELLRAAEGN